MPRKKSISIAAVLSRPKRCCSRFLKHVKTRRCLGPPAGTRRGWHSRVRRPSERRHPNPHTGNQLTSPSVSLPKRPTTEVQKEGGQQHGRVVLVRELAPDCSSPQQWNIHRTRLQLQLSRLLGESDRCDKVGEFHPTPGAVHGTTQRTFHRRCLWYPHAKGNTGTRPVEIRSQRVSMRKTGEAPHKSFHRLPAAYHAYALRCENVLHKVIIDATQPSNASRSVNLFLPRRPRSAYFVVLSSVACKVGRRIRQRGFLVGWYHPNLQSSDLRRLRSDVRTGRVLGAVLCPSCASWSHCRVPHPDWQPTFQAFAHPEPGSAKVRNSMDFDSSSLVSYLAHKSDLLT